MRRRVKEVVPAHEYTRTEFVCDLCVQPIIESRSGFDRNEVTLEARLGDIYPEGDFRTIHSLDICAPCFTNKAKALIEAALGVKFQERDAEP